MSLVSLQASCCVVLPGRSRSSFGSQLDVICAILISGASLVLPSDAGLELMSSDSPSHVGVMLAIVVLVAWIIVGS